MSCDTQQSGLSTTRDQDNHVDSYLHKANICYSFHHIVPKPSLLSPPLLDVCLATYMIKENEI